MNMRKKNLKNNYPQKDMRYTIFLALLNKAKKIKNIYIVSVDYGSPVLDEFRKESKGYKCCISEQNAVSVAAGLSSEGKIVYLYSILTFIVCRSLEQLRLDVCYNNFPINIIGVGPGCIWTSRAYSSFIRRCFNYKKFTKYKFMLQVTVSLQKNLFINF